MSTLLTQQERGRGHTATTSVWIVRHIHRIGLGIALTVLPTLAAFAALGGNHQAAAAPAMAAPAASAAPAAPAAPAARRTSPHLVGHAGTLPPANPAANIAAIPNFLYDCNGAVVDTSAACQNATLQAIDHARSLEGVGPMQLPGDWSRLTAAQQLFVVTNLERVDRGLPALAGMVPALDGAALAAADQNTDPSPPSGFPWTYWAGNWAGGLGSALESDYFWMYSDGPNGTNAACVPSDMSGCWGHRDNELAPLTCSPCVMGSGVSSSAYSGEPSWAELLVSTSGAPALDFAWSTVLASNTSSTSPGAAAAAKAPAHIVGMAAAPQGGGYWLVSSDGNVHAFGAAPYVGSMRGKALSAPIVGMAVTPSGHGYWLVAADGGVFAFGDAAFHGSAGGRHLNQPIVGIAADTTGRGYWLVASDGGIFSYGDAAFAGSTGGIRLNQPIVGMTPAPSGHGYWLVAADGGIFAFGGAGFHGSTGAIHLNKPIVGMTPTSNGHGYWLVAADGGIFAFGNAGYHGSTGAKRLAAPMVGMATAPRGYWLVGSDGGVFSFGAPFVGSVA